MNAEIIQKRKNLKPKTSSALTFGILGGIMSIICEI